MTTTSPAGTSPNPAISAYQSQPVPPRTQVEATAPVQTVRAVQQTERDPGPSSTTKEKRETSTSATAETRDKPSVTTGRGQHIDIRV
jgi:hypothetical protein